MKPSTETPDPYGWSVSDEERAEIYRNREEQPGSLSDKKKLSETWLTIDDTDIDELVVDSVLLSEAAVDKITIAIAALEDALCEIRQYAIETGDITPEDTTHIWAIVGKALKEQDHE